VRDGRWEKKMREKMKKEKKKKKCANHVREKCETKFGEWVVE
jgi:hypothetical protein